MNSSPRVRSTCAGLTAVEALVIIVVVVILLGLLPIDLSLDREQARKSQAKSDEVNIAGAIKAYYAEYGEFPLGADGKTPVGNSSSFIYGQSPAAPTVGSGVSNFQLFDILRNIDSTERHAAGPAQPGGEKEQE